MRNIHPPTAISQKHIISSKQVCLRLFTSFSFWLKIISQIQFFFLRTLGKLVTVFIPMIAIMPPNPSPLDVMDRSKVNDLLPQRLVFNVPIGRAPAIRLPYKTILIHALDEQFGVRNKLNFARALELTESEHGSREFHLNAGRDGLMPTHLQT